MSPFWALRLREAQRGSAGNLPKSPIQKEPKSGSYRRDKVAGTPGDTQSTRLLIEHSKSSKVSFNKNPPQQESTNDLTG